MEVLLVLLELDHSLLDQIMILVLFVLPEPVSVTVLPVPLLVLPVLGCLRVPLFLPSREYFLVKDLLLISK